MPRSAVPSSSGCVGTRVGFGTDRSQMLTEHTALVFLASISPQLVPRRLAADLDQGLMLIEDPLSAPAPCWS